MNGNIVLDLWSDEVFRQQILLWLKWGGIAFIIAFASIFARDIWTSIKGIGGLNQILALDDKLSPKERYTESLRIISENKLSELVVEKWIDTKSELSSVQRADFSDHVRRYVRGSYVHAPGIARYFLLTGLFFTFLALSHTFIDFRNLGIMQMTDFVQDNLIPSVGIALTSTLVAIVFSMAVIFIGTQVENMVSVFRLKLEEYIITHVSPHHPTANPIQNTEHLINIHKDLSELVVKTIEELRNVSSVTHSAYSDLSDATHKFVTAFDSTQRMIQHVETNQEQIVNQNSMILTAATSLKDSVMGIERVFELENSALKAVRESIVASQETVLENSKQLSEISIKFASYNSELQSALATSEQVMNNVHETTNKLSNSHMQNSTQVSKYVDLLTNNMVKVDTTLNGITTLISDAKAIENNIGIEVEKMKGASSEFNNIKSDAADLKNTSKTLTAVGDNIEKFSHTTTESLEKYTGSVKEFKNLVNQFEELSPDLKQFSKASKSIQQLSHDMNSTQHNIQEHAKELGKISTSFKSTYNNYMKRLVNLAHQPSMMSRVKGLFKR